MTRPVKLQINNSGAWRDMFRFDLDSVDAEAVQTAAVQLVEAVDHTGRTSLRICIANAEQTRLIHWNAEKGWT